MKVIHVHGLSINIETPNYTHKLEENLIYDLIMISTKISSFNIIVFGGTGDLAKRKIYPAFYQRFCEKQLDCDFGLQN